MGGTNFGSWDDKETGTSYDYGAAIGQAGDLLPIYYKMTRANQIGLISPRVETRLRPRLSSDRYKQLGYLFIYPDLSRRSLLQ
jgi:hypothetical protein